jgi:histidinol-phosphate aminotransferase
MGIVDQAPSYVRAISPYVPGKPITELARQMGLPVDKIVKLASNENPLGMSPKARAAVAGGLVQRRALSGPVRSDRGDCPSAMA